MCFGEDRLTVNDSVAAMPSDGRKASDFDQYDLEASSVRPHWQPSSPLCKIVCENSNRESRRGSSSSHVPPSKALDFDAIRVDKATQVTVDGCLVH